MNILGKVDPRQSILAADNVYLKMKEAITLNEADYEKVKKTIGDKPVIEPTKEWIEKEKQKTFESVFQELWPNLHKRTHPPPPPPPPTIQQVLQDLEKTRIEQNQKILKEIEICKMSLSAIPAVPANHYDSLSISIKDFKTGNPKIEINPSWPPLPAAKAEPPKPAEPVFKYPHHVSAYDFPYSTFKHSEKLAKSSYNPDDLCKEALLLKSIQESQEKLKLSHKVEKSTDLIDDIIDKVTILQTEMKKKSNAMKMQADLEKIKKEEENMKKLRDSLTSRLIENDDYYLTKELLRQSRERLSRSKSPVTYSNLRSTSSCSSRSVSREKQKHCHHNHVYSILKHHSHTPEPIYSSTKPRKSSKHRESRRASVSFASRPKSSVCVSPKVDCWNPNWKTDRNVY